MTDALIGPSRRTRRTPFSARVEAAGAKAYTVYNHMLLATFFRSMEEDYRHLKRHVQLWDVGCERQVEVVGADAARLVQAMTPRDLGRIAVGQCAYAPLVDEAGGMVNDPVILKLAGDRFWLSLADSDAGLWAQGLACGMGLDVRVFEPQVWPLAIQGPKADALASRVFGDDIRNLAFFRFARFDALGHAFVVARSGWSKQGGFEVYVDDAEAGQGLWDALIAAGEELQVRPGCPNLIERIEGGLLSYGNDMTQEYDPFECGLGRFCHLEAATDFLGRRALEAKLAAGGPKRAIRGIAFVGDDCPPCVEAWPVTQGGQRVGQVTSAARSPWLATNIAIATIDRAAWDEGTAVVVETPAGGRNGRIATLPFAAPAP